MGLVALLLAALFVLSWLIILATGLACAISPSCRRRVHASVFGEPVSGDISPPALDMR